MTKRVLVTGASGFIGAHALPLVVKGGYDVHAVALHEHADEDGVKWHKTDLLDADARRAIIDNVRPTHILHFAWIATPGVYWTSPLNETWKDATLDLLSLAKEAKVQRFVGAGTCAEYDWSSGHCDEKTTSLRPTTPYGKAKAECGTAVVAASNSTSTAWGRIFHLYGPGEHPKRLVPSVIVALNNGERARCTHGKQIRDFLYVADVASAFVALLESDVTGSVNIASGVPITLRAVVECIARQMQKLDQVNFGAIEPPPNDPPQLTADVARLREEVRWRPSMGLEDGIQETIRMFVS